MRSITAKILIGLLYLIVIPGVSALWSVVGNAIGFNNDQLFLGWGLVILLIFVIVLLIIIKKKITSLSPEYLEEIKERKEEDEQENEKNEIISYYHKLRKKGKISEARETSQNRYFNDSWDDVIIEHMHKHAKRDNGGY